MNLGKLIQSWTRFVLQQLNQETDPQSLPPPSQVAATPTSAMGMPPTPSFKMLTPGTPTTPMLQLGMGSFLDSGAANGGFGTPGGEVAPPKGEVSVVEQLFGSMVKTVGKCGCGWSTVTERAELLFSLHYPHNLGGLEGYFAFTGQLVLHICSTVCISEFMPTLPWIVGVLNQVLVFNVLLVELSQSDLICCSTNGFGMGLCSVWMNQ